MKNFKFILIVGLILTNPSVYASESTWTVVGPGRAIQEWTNRRGAFLASYDVSPPVESIEDAQQYCKAIPGSRLPTRSEYLNFLQGGWDASEGCPPFLFDAIILNFTDQLPENQTLLPTLTGVGGWFGLLREDESGNFVPETGFMMLYDGRGLDHGKLNLNDLNAALSLNGSAKFKAPVICISVSQKAL